MIDIKGFRNIFLALLLIFAFTAQDAYAFTNNQWIKVLGYEERKDFQIDRGELSIYLVRLYEEITGGLVGPCKNVFDDVDAGENPYPSKAYALGIMKAAGINKFLPAGTVTGAELSDMLFRVVRSSAPQPESYGADTDFGAAAKDFMVSRGILSFGQVVTSKKVSLEEALCAIDRTLNAAPAYEMVVDTSGFDYTPLPDLRAYLTFDDNVSSLTPLILDTLKEYNAKATFFITGYGDPEIIKRIADEGHSIGNHTVSHIYSKIYSSSESFWAEIEEEEAYLESIIGYKPRLIRFPGGSNNSVSVNYGGKGLMDTLAAEAAQRGYVFVDWNVSARDATGINYTAGETASFVISGSAGKSDAVVLMHQLANKISTYEALPEIITTMRDMGYTFLPLTVNSYAPQFK